MYTCSNRVKIIYFLEGNTLDFFFCFWCTKHIMGYCLYLCLFILIGGARCLVRHTCNSGTLLWSMGECIAVACSSIDWLLQLPGVVLLIGRAPFIYWGVSNYCALTEVFLLPRVQLCSLHRLSWLLLPHDYRHDYFLVSSMLKLSSLKPSKYTRWIFASIRRFVTSCSNAITMQLAINKAPVRDFSQDHSVRG